MFHPSRSDIDRSPAQNQYEYSSYAPTQTGGGGQIAYFGSCTGSDGMGFMNAICGLNVSGGVYVFDATGQSSISMVVTSGASPAL